MQRAPKNKPSCNHSQEGDLAIISGAWDALIRRCHQILHPYTGAYAEAAKCTIALGKRQFALEVFPCTVLDLALVIFKDEKSRKRKWRWPWDAERD